MDARCGQRRHLPLPLLCSRHLVGAAPAVAVPSLQCRLGLCGGVAPPPLNPGCRMPAATAARRPRLSRPLPTPAAPAARPRARSHHGPDCTYLHRLPTAADEERHKTDYSHDIFGRERVPEAWDSRKKGELTGGGKERRQAARLCVGWSGAAALAPPPARQERACGPASPARSASADTRSGRHGRTRHPSLPCSRTAGVGSYERECKTVYVNYGGAGTLPAEQASTACQRAAPARACCLAARRLRSVAPTAPALLLQPSLPACLMPSLAAGAPDHRRQLCRVGPARERAPRAHQDPGLCEVRLCVECGV